MDYNLGMAGTYDSTKMTLSLTLAPGSYDTTKFPLPDGVTGTLTSQEVDKDTGKTKGPVVEYYVIKIASVPEPSSAVLSLIALGTLAAAATLKRASPASCR